MAVEKSLYQAPTGVEEEIKDQLGEPDLEIEIEDPEKVNADETEAEEYAGTLAKDIDHIKALKIEEEKLRVHYKKIQEVKRALKKRIIKKL